MSSTLRVFAFALAASIPSMMLDSCIDIEHTLTLMQDGSGKFVVTVAFDKRDPETPDEELLRELSLTQLAEGFSAWAAPSSKRKGKTILTTLTGYFDDINKVRWFNEKAGKKRDLLLSYTYRRAGAGGTLTTEDAMVDGLKKDAARPVRDASEKPDDDRYQVTVKVPGRIVESKGYRKTQERTASLEIEDKLVFSARKGDKDALKVTDALSGTMTITWTLTEVTPAELEAFRKEHAAVRESWKSLKARYEKLLQEEEKPRDD